MGEYLSVTGTGGSRDTALKNADALAVDYFRLPKDQVNRLDRTVGRAGARQTYDGRVLLWEIDVEYRWLS